MDLVLWIVLGAAVGLIAWVALVGIDRLPLVLCVAIGVGAALVGGVAMHSTLGDIATVRVSVYRGSSLALTTFGLGPFLVSGVTALIALILGHRVTGRLPSSMHGLRP
ncbi:MAG TPA: hypothetical protein VFP24_01155 [Gaiellaceae bacterium]|jgi:hypothetical protein|nr:hypothetical protein [Gaiellaceae bacterium]